MVKARNLRFKINVVIFLTSLIISVIFGVIFYPLELRRHDAHVKRVYLLLDTVFLQRKDDLANELFARQREALAASLHEMLKIEGIVGVAVYLPSGEPFMSTEDVFAVALNDAEREGLSGSSSSFETHYHHDPTRSLGVYSRKIEVIGLEIGFVRFFYDLGKLNRETRSSILVIVTLLGTILLLMFVLLNLLLSLLVIKPVSLLRDAIQRVQEGHLGETVHLSSRDEIGEVGTAFNDMSIELQASQVALKQAEEKYRGIFENAVEGIFQSTPGKGRFLTVNPAMARMLGYDSEDELLTSVSDIASQLYVNPEDHEVFETTLREQGRIISYEAPLLRKDGSVIWVSVSARSVCDEQGVILHCEGSLVDVTERREKEKAQQERQTAEAASKAKSEFLAHMSHEIRTPMNTIVGFSDLLGHVVTNPQHKSYVQSIQSSSRNLMSLIDDILDLSKIEAQKMEIRHDPVNLRSVSDELEKIFSLSVQEAGLEFITEIAPAVPERMLLDEVRLRQVLFNLIGNAVKFTTSGWIKLSAGKGEDTEGDGFHLILTIEDTGAGIHPEAQKRIFEPFSQQSGQDPRKHGGTGLGLTISKNLVEIMGGTITVSSQPGKGSVFEIHLPHVSPAPAGSLLESRQPLDTDRMSLCPGVLLVADDVELNRRLVREFLQDSAIEVIEASNGREAVRAAKASKPDLILMDIKMPVMDGYEAAADLRRDEATRRIPIIAVTASAMREDVERIKRAGFDQWLLRPFERPDLLAKLAAFLGLPQTQPGSMQSSDGSPWLDERALSHLTEGELAEFSGLLANELMEDWKMVSLKQNIVDIERFGRRMGQVGERYGVQPLSALAQDLLFHVAAFDVENIAGTLRAFPLLVDAVKQVQSQ